MDIDSLISIGAIGRCLRDLQDRPFKRYCIVLSHGTLLFETQSLFDLKRAEFSPGRLCFSGLSELTVMHGEVPIQDGLSLFHALSLGQPQLTDQPILESVPQSLDSPLGLRGMGQDQSHPELF